MLNPYFFSGTIDKPKVSLNNETGVFEFSGRSLPEDASKFYAPIKDWMLEYIKNPAPATKLIFDLDYYNSSTAKILIKLLVELEKIQQKGFQISILWKYKENDEVMLERGDEIRNFVKMPFELLKY